MTAPNAGGGIDTFVSAVYYDTATKGLDFFYQVQNTYTGTTTASNTLTSSFTISDFGGFATDVYQLRASGSGVYFGATGSPFLKPNTDAIKSVARSADGSAITLTLTNTVTPRANTSVFEVKTDARNFDGAGVGAFSWKAAPPAGSTGVASSINFELSTLEPITTPEPGFYGVLSAGLISLAFFNRRKLVRVKA